MLDCVSWVINAILVKSHSLSRTYGNIIFKAQQVTMPLSDGTQPEFLGKAISGLELGSQRKEPGKMTM